MKKIYFLFVALLFTLSAGAQTLRGDINGDGIVNIGDVTDLVNIILYGDEEAEPDTPVVPEEPATDSRAIDLGLPSGLKWASCNVGATAPEEYGGYYAWGETEEKSNYEWSNYKYFGIYDTMSKYCTSSFFGTLDNKTTLEPEDDVACVQWGGSWRMPTKDEQNELLNNCTWEWTTLNGIYGYRVTGPNGNNIFLPVAGGRHGTEVSDQGNCAYYWSSSLYSSNSKIANLLYMSSNGCGWATDIRCYGLSVRPVCE